MDHLKLFKQYRCEFKYEEGLKHLRLAVQLDVAEAMFWLGYYYENTGLTICKKKVKKAKALYRKSAEKGCELGMVAYGIYCYAEEQTNWFRKAFQGYNLYVKGILHHHFMLPECKRSLAVQYFLASSMQEDNPLSFFMLGICYSNDCLLKDEKASEWYLKSAKQGLAQAQCFYAESMYQKKMINSYIWYKKAADQGHYYAKLVLTKNILLQKMKFYIKCSDSLIHLLMIRKFRKNSCGDLGRVPYDVVLIIARDVWNTRNEDCWKIL